VSGESLIEADIARARLAHAAKVLHAMARALRFSGRFTGKNPAKVAWTLAENRIVQFHLAPEEIQITSKTQNGAISQWGTMKYPALDAQIRKWIQSHPDQSEELRREVSLQETQPPMGNESSRSERTATEITDCRYSVTRNRQICEKHFRMDVEIPGERTMALRSGQFFHVLCDPEADGKYTPPLTLRRPLSIHRIEYDGFRRSSLAMVADIPAEMREAIGRHPVAISFLYRVVGEGTRLLSQMRKGNVIDAIGPLGNGFSIGNEHTAVIVAGGIGVAPLAALAEELRFAGKEVLVYLGAVRKEMLSLSISHLEDPEAADPDLYEVIRSEFREIGVQVLGVCTDDGSAGAQGLVPDLFAQGIRDGCVPQSDVCIYSCGPKGMMQAVAEIAARHDLPCQVSLEERMACGIGACYSCTCRVIGADGVVHKKRVCREGPVFPAKDIQWKD